MIRKYDPIENYLLRCKRCHEIGNAKCDSTKNCPRCMSADCKDKSCDVEKLKCVNCGKSHSAYYRAVKNIKMPSRKLLTKDLEKLNLKKLTKSKKP